MKCLISGWRSGYSYCISNGMSERSCVRMSGGRDAGAGPRRGFALMATVALLALLTVITLGYLSLSTIEVRQASLQKYDQEARANAHLALMLALGELQKQVGPDQRVTAPAALLDENPGTDEVEGVRHPHWTGVWSTAMSDGLPVWVRNDAGRGLQDRRPGSGWRRENEVISYLVSGNEGGRRAAGSAMLDARNAVPDGEGEVEVVGEGSLGSEAEALARGRVVVPKRKVETGPRKAGHYGFWVGDLGVRANIATRNRHEDASAAAADYRLLTSQEANPELMDGASGAEGIALEEGQKDLLISEGQLDLLGSDVKAWRRELFHDVTVDSEGVLANVRDGGLRRDLTAYLQSNGTVPALSGHPESGLSDHDRLVGPRNELVAAAEGINWEETGHRHTAPRFGLLRDWALLGERIQSPTTVVDAIIPKSEPVPRFPNLGARQANVNLTPATIADFDTTNLAPVLVEGSYMTSLSRHEVHDIRGNWQMRLHVYPRVVLWNPFNVTLRFPKSMVMIQGNGRKEYHVRSGDGRVGNVREYVWLWASRGEEIENGTQFWAAYESPYAGNIYFTVPETVFAPGECLVFSCGSAMEYDSDALEANLLSAEVGPDPGKNFYFSGSDVSAFLHEPPPLEWWEQPVSWTARSKNQADDNQMLLKVIGNERNVDYAVYDYLPAVSQVSCSLQYGGGREPRIQWNQLNPVVMEETLWDYDRNPLKRPPDVRSRDGFRMRWFWEHRSNELGSGGLLGTPHFQSALMANWNLRAAYTLRSPWDNLAGTLPKGNANVASNYFGGGPWFFGAYTRDLFDEAVGFNDQAPVLRDGKYRGNPFGQPQDFSTFQTSYVLFDVPKAQSGVLSLAQFQHAKLSEFVWHPAYAVGQSLADPRVGLTGTLPDAAVGDVDWDPAAIGWSNDRDRSSNKDEWAQFAKAILQDYAEEDRLVYDLSFEVNHSLWDEFYLSTGTAAAKASFLRDPYDYALPNGRHVLAESTKETATAERLADFYRSAYHLMVDGAFNVNSTSVDAWKAMLGATRNAGYGSTNATPFPRVLDAPGGEWLEGRPSDPEAWSGHRSLSDGELARLAEEIVREVKTRGPFLSLSDFVNRRLAANETGKRGTLESAIDAAGLNVAFEAGQEFALENNYSLPDYRHPDNIEDPTRLEQTLKPSSKAWGAPGYLTQGDVLQVVGSTLSARSDSFVVRAYGDAVDETGTVRARAWCEAVVQRIPEPLEPDETGLDSRELGTSKDFGRKFEVRSFRWLNPEEI